MKKTFSIFFIAFFSISCYTETKKPDYKFMNKIKEQSDLDSSLKTMIALKPKKYFFRKARKTDKFNGSFFIKNLGNIDFNIVSIKSNCPCVKTTYINTKVIRPHDSLLVKYEMVTDNSVGIFKNSIIAIGNCQNGNQTYYFEGNFNNH